MIDFGIYLTYVMFFVALIAAVVLPIIKSLDDPQSLMYAGIGIGGIVVIFLISWMISDNEVTAVYQAFDVDASGSKLVGGSLISMYLLFVIALGGIVVSEVSKLLK